MNIITKDLYADFIPMQLDIRGWNSNSDVFEKLIIETKPSVIIEVGTWKGASAITMANCVKALSLKTDIYCVDTWLGAEEFWCNEKHTEERGLFQKHGYPQIYYQFLSNVYHTNNTNIITPVPNTSYIGYLILKHYNIKAQLIYIDGSHEYADVLSDIKHYKDLLSDDGILFGDDYCWTGVRQAVEDSFETHQIELYQDNFWCYSQQSKKIFA